MRIRRILARKLHKEPTKSHCLKIIQRQQEVINAMSETILQGRALLQSILPPEPGKIVTPDKVPFIIPTTGGQHAR